MEKTVDSSSSRPVDSGFFTAYPFLGLPLSLHIVMDVSSSGSVVTIAIPDYHARITESLRQKLTVQKTDSRRAGITRHKLAQLFLLVCG